MSNYESNPLVVKFLSDLCEIPWFKRLGFPLKDVVASERILSWNEWPGPEDPSVLVIHEHHQHFYDEMLGHGNKEDMLKLWNYIQLNVIRMAASNVPYTLDGDSWYGPNTAVWQAAWTAGLVGLCILAERPLPDEISIQWEWFLRGRWPCAWIADSKTAVVF